MDSKTLWYQLKPTDAWFFRDGKPMNRGQDAHVLTSLFPPVASTVIGSFRASLAHKLGWSGKGEWSDEIKQVLGDGYDDLGKLTFSGPFLSYRGEPVFPLPYHVVGKTDEEKFEPTDWLVPSDDAVESDLGRIHLPLPPIRKPGEPVLSYPENYYITSQGLEKVLAGKRPNRDECISTKELFAFEHRVGIALQDDTRTTIDGALFNPRFVRLKPNVGLIVGLSGLKEGIQPSSLLALGGESRMAHCEQIEKPNLPNGARQGNCLIFLTPALFKSADSPWWGVSPGEQASLVTDKIKGLVKTVATDRPLRATGWDSRNGHPIPQKPLLPPGTVWWLEDKQQSADNQNFLSIGQSTSHGYGLALLGTTPGNRK